MNDVLYLLKGTVDQDDIGNLKKEYTKREVFCKALSIDRNEFFHSGQIGLKPKFKFIIYPLDYNDEDIIEYMGNKYGVYRTYLKNENELELYAEEKAGVKNV